ncbi:unnamed protein product [Rhizophagus irregularis]|nr:unnamed protein product [Rhizophagus irregularis]
MDTFENFQNITYIAKGGFGKVYSAEWPEGCIGSWDIENQKWYRFIYEYALKSLNNSSDISLDFLNEIKSHLQIYLNDIVQCYGITQDPNTKEYMMVLQYCEGGNFRNNFINKELGYYSKIDKLRQIASGLLDIHNSGKVHKDFHSGNILYIGDLPYISDLGMCQPANKKSVKEEGICGVLPYVAPEVLRGHQYTKASDIYSFGIMMNEYISEETPYSNMPHDDALAFKICKGLRPSIFKYTPKLLADLITKCWDAEVINRPTAKELYQTLNKWNNDEYEDSDQVNEYNDKIKLNRTSEKRYNNIPKHPQAIYTSRLLDFKNLPEPANSGNLIYFNNKKRYITLLIICFLIDAIQSALLSECLDLDIQLDELDLNEIDLNEIAQISVTNY